MVPGRLGIPIVALGAAVKYGGGEGEKRRVRNPGSGVGGRGQPRDRRGKGGARTHPIKW